MDQAATALAQATSVARDAVRELLDSGTIRALSDDDLTSLASAAGDLLRLAEAALVEVAGEVEARSQTPIREERFSVKRGCHDVPEFLRWVAGVGSGTAARWLRASHAVRGGTSVTTGETLPPALPALREVVATGAVSVDGILAVSQPLLAAQPRVDHARFAFADEQLAELARGDQAIPTTVNELKINATAWATILDQDGAEPVEVAAARKRSLTISAVRDGLVEVRGMLTVDVGSVLQRLVDTGTNPRVGGVRFRSSDEGGELIADDRSANQRRHDAFAMVLTLAAATDALPRIGGAAPTLIVHASEHDVASGTGHAFIDGVPVSLSVARHAGCSGVIQRVVFDDGGRVVSTSITDRVFNRAQRRAIEARDGGCVIPGCPVTASSCEIHHVVEWSRGGTTTIDNGVPLCWYHHRFIDIGGWEIRMNGGVPETRAPAWIDPQRRWRPHQAPPPARIART